MSNSSGFATLEAGLYSVLLIGFITGAFATLDYLRLQSQLSSSLQSCLQSSSLAPYRLRSDSSGIRLQLDQNTLHSHLSSALSEVETSLQNSLGTRLLETQNYLIEANYFEIGIDQTSGQSTGVRSSGLALRLGSLSIPADIEEKTQLENQIEQTLDFLVDPSGKFLYASPSVQFGSASNIQYLPAAVIISMRVIMKIPQGLTRNILQTLNLEPITYAINSATLRGEVGL